MTTKSTVPTVANGDSWSAAQHNTYLRDNIEAVWPYTTAGDLGYATAANQLARLGLGTAYKFLQAEASAPAWGGLHFANVSHNTTQTVATGTPTALTFNTELFDAQGWHSTSVNPSRITVGVGGNYLASVYLQYAGAGGTGQYWDTAELRVNGVVGYADRRYQNIDAFSKMFSISFPPVYLNATNYVEIFLEQNSGGTRTVQANCVFGLWRLS